MIVLVPTYSRPHLFARLCADLRRELSPRDVLIVYDDASPAPYAGDVLVGAGLHEHLRDGACTLIRAAENGGRRDYWRTVGALLDAALGHLGGRRTEDELVAYLADDVRLVEDWRARVSSRMQRVRRHPGCIGLHAHRDGRTREWGLPGGEDIDGEGERMAWQDGLWVTRARWLEAMRPHEVRRDWTRHPHLGSGAWRSSSYRTHEAGLWWYRPIERLCWHDDDGVSVMNPLATSTPARRAARRVCTVSE